jgi:hypothetical protein
VHSWGGGPTTPNLPRPIRSTRRSASILAQTRAPIKSDPTFALGRACRRGISDSRSEPSSATHATLANDPARSGKLVHEGQRRPETVAMDVPITKEQLERLLDHADWLRSLARRLVHDSASADDLV